MTEWRELSELMRVSVDEWIARAGEANPGTSLRRSGAPRREGNAWAIPLADQGGSRYEVLAWPDGSVNGLRELA